MHLFYFVKQTDSNKKDPIFRSKSKPLLISKNFYSIINAAKRITSTLTHLTVEPHGQARGTTWFRPFASRTPGLSGTTSRLYAHSSTAKAVAFCGRNKIA